MVPWAQHYLEGDFGSSGWADIVFIPAHSMKPPYVSLVGMPFRQCSEKSMINGLSRWSKNNEDM